MLSYFGLPVVKLVFRCCFAKVESSPVKPHHIVENSTNSLFLLFATLKRITFWTEWKVSHDTPGYCTVGFRYVFYINTKPVWVYLIYSVFFFCRGGGYNLKTKMSKTKTPILWHIFGNIYIRQKQWRLDIFKKSLSKLVTCQSWQVFWLYQAVGQGLFTHLLHAPRFYFSWQFKKR